MLKNESLVWIQRVLLNRRSFLLLLNIIPWEKSIFERSKNQVARQMGCCHSYAYYTTGGFIAL